LTILFLTLNGTKTNSSGLCPASHINRKIWDFLNCQARPLENNLKKQTKKKRRNKLLLNLALLQDKWKNLVTKVSVLTI
jgi:hypothetical protein